MSFSCTEVTHLNHQIYRNVLVCQKTAYISAKMDVFKCAVTACPKIQNAKNVWNIVS